MILCMCSVFYYLYCSRIISMFLDSRGYSRSIIFVYIRVCSGASYIFGIGQGSVLGTVVFLSSSGRYFRANSIFCYMFCLQIRGICWDEFYFVLYVLFIDQGDMLGRILFLCTPCYRYIFACCASVLISCPVTFVFQYNYYDLCLHILLTSASLSSFRRFVYIMMLRYAQFILISEVCLYYDCCVQRKDIKFKQ